MRIIPLLLILLMGCSAHRERQAVRSLELSFAPGPHALVYRTREDYHDLVPVILSEDRSQVVSYPAPADLRRGDAMVLPFALEKGYWLDRRGIGPQVAFTSYTYEEYAALQEAPAPELLLKEIVDDEPLTDLCDCGLLSQFEDPVNDLNRIIKLGKLKPCKRILGE